MIGINAVYPIIIKQGSLDASVCALGKEKHGRGNIFRLAPIAKVPAKT
jgi:hypothetical protein